MLRVAFYARYSSDNQSTTSIEDRLRLRDEHARREGWSVAQIYRDAAISGASVVLRPGIQLLLFDAQAGQFDIVLAEALDRISRDQADVATLFKHLRFCRREDHHAGRGRNLRVACRPQGHNERALSERPRHEDASRPAWAGRKGAPGRWPLLWL